jgi:hypothetical protein
LFSNAVSGEPVAQASCLLILAVGSQARCPAYPPPGRLLQRRRGSPELAPPSAGSLKFRHFSATTSSGKKQRRIPAAGCGS